MAEDTKGYITYGKDQGISEAKAKEYWESASKSVKEETGKTKEELTNSDWQHIMGVYKKIVNNSKKQESFTTTKNYIIEGNIINKDATIIVESHGSDLPNVSKYADPLSKIKGKGTEYLSMDYRDGHQAIFENGLLVGFTWFNKKVSGMSAFINSRPATMFAELYGIEGEKLLNEAVMRL